MEKNKIYDVRRRTLEDVKLKLKKYGKVCCVRPTGFGKTVMASVLIADYKRVLFVYPLEVIHDVVVTRYADSVEHVEFMTYMKLARMTDDEIKKLPQYDLIIFDECHRMGGDETAISVRVLLKYQKSHLLGLTATPERMDLFDVVCTFFDDVTVFRYTLHDAFQDEVLMRPYYCYCSYDIASDFKKARGSVKGDKVEIEEQLTALKQSYIQACRLFKMDKIIGRVCREHTNTNYMRFIVFFSNVEHLESKCDDVKDWFQKAFKKHNIQELRVTSDDDYGKNIAELSKLDKRDKGIDLVYSIDMINMGYHVEDLTGIVMYRGTQSGTVFYQQLGRVLSSAIDPNTGKPVRGIVFDVVDNVHVHAMYDILGKKSKKTKEWRLTLIKAAVEAKLLPDSVLSSNVEVERLINGAIFQIDGIEEIIRKYKGEGYTLGVSDPWGYNELEPQDLIATGHEAEYRDIIRKADAESEVIRARRAYKDWKENGGKEEPDIKEYIDEGKRGKRKFILEQTDPPLGVFARSKWVSTEAVLNIMGL